ncbi:MAG: methyltransferase domain-containing protein [Acidobacteriota bacterium]
MTLYEIARRLAWPVLPVLHGRAMRDLQELVYGLGRAGTPRLLDIGGRSSPYTVGLRARVTILDVPRASEVQESLHLGVDARLEEHLTTRRSNLEGLRLEDMCTTTLPDASFDGVVAVEVIEHVEDDATFVAQTARVLAPHGWAYFTTPNGEWVKNEAPHYNPDHVRHYTRAELEALLRTAFDEVDVVYAVRTGRHRYRGLRSFSPRRPFAMLSAMAANVINHVESRAVDTQSRRTAHLIARARRPRRGSS